MESLILVSVLSIFLPEMFTDPIYSVWTIKLGVFSAYHDETSFGVNATAARFYDL